MIFELHPPQAAGSLRIGETGHDTVEILTQLGVPQVLCKTPGSQPAWAVFRPSGLFISAYFDADDRVEAIEFGRPRTADDEVTYDGLDVFTTPAADLVAHLRRRTAVQQEEVGHVLTAPSLLLSFWTPVIPGSPDDGAGRFFQSVLLARPGYYDNPARAAEKPS
jgi:hypothetical protein